MTTTLRFSPHHAPGYTGLPAGRAAVEAVVGNTRADASSYEILAELRLVGRALLVALDRIDALEAAAKPAAMAKPGTGGVPRKKREPFANLPVAVDVPLIEVDDEPVELPALPDMEVEY